MDVDEKRMCGDMKTLFIVSWVLFHRTVFPQAKTFLSNWNMYNTSSHIGENWIVDVKKLFRNLFSENIIINRAEV